MYYYFNLKYYIPHPLLYAKKNLILVIDQKQFQTALKNQLKNMNRFTLFFAHLY